jgi:hypothetical protein
VSKFLFTNTNKYPVVNKSVVWFRYLVSCPLCKSDAAFRPHLCGFWAWPLLLSRRKQEPLSALTRPGCRGIVSCRFATSAPCCHCVVLSHHTLRLHAEDPVQTTPGGSPKCRPSLCRRHAEPVVELLDVFLSQKAQGERAEECGGTTMGTETSGIAPKAVVPFKGKFRELTYGREA